MAAPSTGRVATFLALLAVVVVGCAGGPGPTTSDAPEPEAAEPDPAPEEPDDQGEPGEPEADDQPAAEPDEVLPDPAEIGADELGTVPVLMYHRLREDGGSDYDLTAEEFRAELEWLFDNDYSPVLLKDLARGQIDVPAGRSPVVLTFDDSTREQAWLDDDGELHPDSALGILQDVADGHDGVEPLASVYVITSSLFGGGQDGPAILAHLHELGMEIGNHTHNHPNLATIDADEVRDELARHVATVTDLVPDAEVVTLSLPLGVFPEDRELAASGSAEVGSYEHEGVLLVGAEPARSPFAGAFDALAIPRIRTSPSWDGGEPDWGSAFWLEQLDGDGQWQRYVSDGAPDRISFPSERAEELDPRYEDRANPY